MSRMKDYVIEVAEVIEKWLPFLEWEDIMEVATSDNFYSRKAMKVVRNRMKERGEI